MHDPLSDVFALLSIRAARVTRLEAAGRWSFRFPARSRLKFVAVLRGACTLAVDGDGQRELAAGDTILLTNAPSYVVANDPELAAVDGMTAFDWARSDVARHDGDDTILLGGIFEYDDIRDASVLGALPTVVHVPAGDLAAPVLRATLALLDRELAAGAIGSGLMTRRLGDILLVQALRAHVDRGGAEAAGWLGALADRQIGTAPGADAPRAGDGLDRGGLGARERHVALGLRPPVPAQRRRGAARVSHALADDAGAARPARCEHVPRRPRGQSRLRLRERLRQCVPPHPRLLAAALLAVTPGGRSAGRRDGRRQPTFSSS